MTIKDYFKEKTTLNEAELSKIKAAFKPVQFPKKTMILEEGGIARFLYFIEVGLLKTYFIDRNGHEVILNFASESWWVTDVHSFEESKASRLYIETLEDSQCQSITLEDYLHLMDELPHLERFFRTLLLKHVGALQERLFEQIAATAEDRYDSFLERYPSLQNRIPQNQISNFIGVSPEFLSRIRKRKVSR